ncbi:SRPBCC family protein [Nocardia sp. NPDC050697]|uniref:SRPBCC family protein n=1 Tax=Nocardia sp. NPDC050697 TaxID=3155158 RepID=UPI0034083CDB
MRRIQAGEVLSASIDIAAPADAVYALVSDITRIPEWSPETVRVRRLDPAGFRSWNRRRLGVWRTDAKIVESIPGERFSFVVQAMGGDWTQWTYRLEPRGDSTRLTEEFRMCVALPTAILAFEWLFLLVRDRRADLRQNLETSVARIGTIIESGAARRRTGEHP